MGLWTLFLIHVLISMSRSWKNIVRLGIKIVFLVIELPVGKMRQYWDSFIVVIDIRILVRRHLYIETGPCFQETCSRYIPHIPNLGK